MFWETGCHTEAMSWYVFLLLTDTHNDSGYTCSDVVQQEHQIILLQIATITKAFVLRTAATPCESWVLLQDSSNLVLRTELLAAAGAHWCLVACSTFGWIWLMHSETNGANQKWRVGQSGE